MPKKQTTKHTLKLKAEAQSRWRARNPGKARASTSESMRNRRAVKIPQGSEIISQNENTEAVDQSKAPDADKFRAGDVWMTPAGGFYRVLSIHRVLTSKGTSMIATLKAGSSGPGRRSYRRWDDTGLKCGRPWARISWGGK